ncbi:Uncharacterised protein [Mycobacteroides abscessus subsp. abscessus]|uniref:hypothetical protein n=1 Tax=Mycobacteroides abscessus TaxID=36809 RepID=UPI00092B3D48|nr:hypothetical protein [Mycobacteroides abscessus]SHU69354.1 Uncharacterised protein [Mycobacteroides abscessus subsp. abscessus]
MIHGHANESNPRMLSIELDVTHEESATLLGAMEITARLMQDSPARENLQGLIQRFRAAVDHAIAPALSPLLSAAPTTV